MRHWITGDNQPCRKWTAHLKDRDDDSGSEHSWLPDFCQKPVRRRWEYKALPGAEPPVDDAETSSADHCYDHRDPSPIRGSRNTSKHFAVLASLYITTNVFYLFSLRGASTPQEMNALLGFLGFSLVSSVILFSLHFWIATILLHISPRWRASSALLQLATPAAWYLVDSGNRLETHGAFNLLIFSIILVPSNTLIGSLYFWYLATSPNGEKRARRFWSQLLAVVFAASLFVFFAAMRKQHALAYGFFDRPMHCSAAQRSSSTCDSCQWGSAIPWFDLLPFRVNVFVGPMTCPSEDSFAAHFDDNDRLAIECSASRTEAKSWFNGSVLLSHTDAIYAPLPRTEKWGLTLKADSLENPNNPFQERVIRFAEARLTPYDGPVTLVDDDTDTVLVMCGGASLKIVNRIVPAIEQVKNTKPPGSPNEKLNVVTIFIDAVSRRQFHRRLPNTRRVLERAVTANGSASSLFEFSRYHKVGYNTGPNTRALWAGLDERDPLAAGIPLWEQFQAAGYVSAHIDPSCQDWTAYYDAAHFNSTTNSVSIGESTDKEADPEWSSARLSHEYLAWSCFPPYLPLGKLNTGNFAGPTSIKARCISGTHVGWHELDYATALIRQYRQRGQALYLNAAFMEGHEGSGEVLATLDARLARFLDPITTPMDLNNTAIFIVSDHGALMGLNNAFFENGKIEAANPAAVMLLPEWFIRSESSNNKGSREELLRMATERLVTAHDFYETVRGFIRDENGSADGEEYLDEHSVARRGIDMLREPVNDRTCAEARITETACKCN